MSNSNIPPIDILTDTWQTVINRTNSLITSVSSEIITANSTMGITGSSISPRNATLFGTFTANALSISSNTFSVNTSVLTLNTKIAANNSVGSPGYILTSSGAAGNVYWSSTANSALYANNAGFLDGKPSSFFAPAVVFFADVAGMTISSSTTSIRISDRMQVVLVDATAETLHSNSAGYWWTTSNGGTRKWKIAYTGRINPISCGAVGDGVWNFTTLTATGTDDRLAVQAAIDYFQTQGLPGVVEFSRMHRINSLATLGASMDAALHLWGDNIALQRTGAGLIGCAISAGNPANFDRGLHISGGFKTGTLDPYANRCVDKSGYTVSGSYAKGSKSVTLATVGDAANFARGDVCFIRSGQTLLTTTFEPDSELLICNSADPATGIVTFETRTNAPYCREALLHGDKFRTTSGIYMGPAYANTGLNAVTVGAGGSNYSAANTPVSFSGGGSHPNKRLPTATANVTANAVTAITITDPGEWLESLPTLTIGGTGTGATGWAAQFGTTARFELVNVTDRVLRNAYVDIDLISNNLGQCLNIWGAMGVTVAPTTRIWTGWCGAGSRDSSEVKWGGSVYQTGRVVNGYWLGPSTGCSNWDVKATMRANGWGYMHLHEGTKNMRINLDATCVGYGSTYSVANMVDMGARAYDIYVEGRYDSGDGEIACIGVDESCRDGITFGPLQINSNRPNTSGSAISIVNAPNVMFCAEPLMRGASGRLAINGGIQGARTTLFGVRLPTRVHAPFLFNKTTEFLDLELDEYIESVIIQVDEAFTGGDRRLYIGYGARNFAFLSNVNLSTLGLSTSNLAYVYRRGDTGAGDRLGLGAPSQQRVQTYLLGGTTDYTAGAARISLVLGHSARVL